MTIYKHKLENDVQPKNSDKEAAAVLTDDDEVSDDGDQMNSYLVKTNRQTMFHRRRPSILKCFIASLVLFIVLFVLGTIFWYHKSSSKSVETYVGLVRMHYHTWIDNAAGVKRSFKLEGEFYQQVEIDVKNEAYEKLNVPSVMNMQRASVVHDFHQRLTAIVSLDRGHCFILPLNATFVKPLPEFFKLVKHIEAGYDPRDAEITSDDYSVFSTKINDVSQFGKHIHRHCRYLETYRLVRDDEPLAVKRKSVCRFRGEQYCLGSAGTEYMGIVRISQCVD